VRHVPWSRVPTNDSQYISRSEQLERFRARYEANPFA
jgi:hypothetical protein